MPDFNWYNRFTAKKGVPKSGKNMGPKKVNLWVLDPKLGSKRGHLGSKRVILSTFWGSFLGAMFKKGRKVA